MPRRPRRRSRHRRGSRADRRGQEEAHRDTQGLAVREYLNLWEALTVGVETNVYELEMSMRSRALAWSQSLTTTRLSSLGVASRLSRSEPRSAHMRRSS